MELTHGDFQLLLDGLDALALKATNDGLIDMMLTGMLTSPDERKKAVNEVSEKMKAKEAAARPMRERIILIKAKLITMRDSQTAEREASLATA